jgi:hypothetical protein
LPDAPDRSRHVVQVSQFSATTVATPAPVDIRGFLFPG